MRRSNAVDKKSLRIIRKSEFFDAEWYRTIYPDVAAARIDPALHYLTHGAREGRDPSPSFSTRAYLQLNPDVCAARLNPLLHYEMHGRREGRLYSYDNTRDPVFPEGAVDSEKEFGVVPREKGRTAVFAAFFSGGRIPEADIYYIRGLREVVDNIVFVADCPVFPEELNKLEGLVCKAICRRHGEYDFGSYKRGYACAEELGLLEPSVATELVMANDSCLGPVFPFSEAFDKMAGVACDFWGMTQHKTSNHVHIQSFFYVFRERPLHSGAVGDFFREFTGTTNRIDVILNGELRLTDFLVERGGYTFTSLVPIGLFDDLPMKFPVSMLKRFRMPLVKVKTLRGDSREQLWIAKEFVSKTNPAVARFMSAIKVDPAKEIKEQRTWRWWLKYFVPYGMVRIFQQKHWGVAETSPYDSGAGFSGRAKRMLLALLPYHLSRRFVVRRKGDFIESPPGLVQRLRARKGGDPLVSVVVASYNYENLVVETLESLWSQDYRNFEIVVVDDGSQDASRENIQAFIDAHAGADVEIRLLTHPGGENRGLAATVELGVRESRGEYVAFCESDDLWTPDHLSVLVSEIKRYARPNVVVNDVAIFGDTVGVARAERNRALRYRMLCHTWNRIPPRAFRKMNYLLTFSCVMVKRSILLKCDYHPDAHPPALDWWLWRQVCFGNDVFFVKRPLTRWRMHDSYLEKTRVVKSSERPIADREKALMEGCDKVIRAQHPFSFTARFLMVPPERKGGPKYRMTGARKRQFYRHRALGRKFYREKIAQNRGARVLVCLHLFYEDAWPLISEYLENLAPYSYDLLVTCVEGALSQETLDAVKGNAAKVQILELPNNGFDIGPFVEALNHVNLDDYDIVFKLQSKGIRRKFIYIYNQIFKWSDWFFNLFDGVLDGMAVHMVVDALMNGGDKLAAAKNLVVRDPKHKQYFVQSMCEQRGLEYVEDYKFVAGTCFAIRAEALKPLKALGLSISDFEDTERGTFSLAHFLERWMCFAAQGAIKEVPTSHNVYPAEARAKARTSAIRLLDDPRFKIDYDFFYRVLEMRPIKEYDVVEVRLGDIHRRWFDGRILTLDECEPFKYLNGDTQAYEAYCEENKALSGFAMDSCRFDQLVSDMEEYDPLSMPVVMGPNNIIFDGQHRSCILLKKYGPDHVIQVLRFS